MMKIIWSKALFRIFCRFSLLLFRLFAFFFLFRWYSIFVCAFNLMLDRFQLCISFFHLFYTYSSSPSVYFVQNLWEHLNLISHQKLNEIKKKVFHLTFLSSTLFSRFRFCLPHCQQINKKHSLFFWSNQCKLNHFRSSVLFQMFLLFFLLLFFRI